MASSTPPSQGSVLLEWVREWLPRSGRDAFSGEEAPRRRGVLISICVLISTVLWFTLSIRETYTILVEMPTTVVQLPADTALAALPPPMVQVQLRGEGIELFGLRLNPPTLPIDASQNEVNFTSLVNLPQGVTAENVSPRLFNLQKEQRISRTIPIRSRAVVEAAETHDLFEKPKLSPDSVTISGARSLVNDIDAWPTVLYRHVGLKDSLRVDVPLVDTLAGLIEVDHTETTVTAVADAYTEGWRELKVEVTGVPTTQSLTQRVVQLEPATVRVTYRVPLSQYDQAQEAADFYVTISYDEIRSDTTGRVRPDLHLPTALSLRNINYAPSTLQYYERLIEQ